MLSYIVCVLVKTVQTMEILKVHWNAEIVVQNHMGVTKKDMQSIVVNEMIQ